MPPKRRIITKPKELTEVEDQLSYSEGEILKLIKNEDTKYVKMKMVNYSQMNP